MAFHEGAWGSTTDGTDVYQMPDSSDLGYKSVADANEASPGAWDVGPDPDRAFRILDDFQFGSGFEDGVTCAWTVTSGGSTCP